MTLVLTIDLVHPFNLEAILGLLDIVKVKLVQARHSRQLWAREASQRRKAKTINNPENVLEDECAEDAQTDVRRHDQGVMPSLEVRMK
jgi:hypothetical protein